MKQITRKRTYRSLNLLDKYLTRHIKSSGPHWATVGNKSQKTEEVIE